MTVDQLIPTGDMTLDPRLRKLFALVGAVLWAGDVEAITGERLERIMLVLAPEYVPPDEDCEDVVYQQWAALVEQARIETSR